MVFTRLLDWVNRPQMTNRMRSLVNRYAELGKFSGAVMVARGDDLLLSMACGTANRATGMQNTPATIFRIGSMTKPFTAIAIMQLVESGEIRLDDRVSSFLPDYAHGDGIAIEHLLGNTSGIPDYILLPEYQGLSGRNVAPQELVNLFANKPLLFAPGTQFSYSNSGWVLLGMIAERIAGKAYGELVKERILARAGMTDSGYDWEALPTVRRAEGYDGHEGASDRSQPIDSSTMYAAGGLYSTTQDLLRWAKALDSNALLRRETLVQMTQPVSPEYGLGWELGLLHGKRYFSHSGGLPGFVSNFLRIPAENVSIIVLSNLGGAAISELTDGLAAILVGAPYQLPVAFTFTTVDTAILQEYVGDYEVTYFGRTSTLKFRLEDGSLVMTATGLPKATLSAISPTTFFARSKGEIVMTFCYNESQRVDRITMQWAGREVVAKRKPEMETQNGYRK